MKPNNNTQQASLSDYEKEFHIFQNNVNNAARAFYYNITLNELAKNDPKIICVLNETPWFWNDFRHHTLIAVYIMLGRIFDKPKRARNLFKFMGIARLSNYSSQQNLRLRKAASSENAFEWIDEYMRGTHALTDKDFDKMDNFIKAIESDWKKIEDVRHKIIAHQEMFLNDHEEKEVHKSSDVVIIESIIRRLLIIEHVLEEAGLNGRKPDYDFVPQRTEKLAKEELDKMVRLLSSGCSLSSGDQI